MNINIYIGKLICDLISFNMNEKQKEELKQFSDIQWLQLYDFAKLYNLTPLLYSKMHKLSFIDIVPKNILYQLQNDYNSFSCTSMKREHEIKQILKQLNDSGIDVILLKGLYISETYYDNPAERPMCDVDLLVNFSELDKVSKILRMYGCSFESNLNADECKDFIQHLPIITTPKGCAIEVHWKLTADFNDVLQVKYNIDELWSTKEHIKLYNAECFVFKKEYLLIHLCVHITEDLFQQKILQLYDVFLILRKLDINWELLFQKAEAWNCSKAVYSVLSVIIEVFTVVLPELVYTKINEQFENSEDIRNALIFAVFKDLETVPKDANYTEKLRNKSNYDKLKYAIWTTFDKERLIFWNGKTEFVLILYVKRIFWLIRKYTKIFFKRILFSNREDKAVSKELDINFIRKWLEL